MDALLNWIETLTSFQQSMLGAAVFSFSSWLAQKIFKKAKSSGSAFMQVYSEIDVHKHVLHKEYVRSGNIQLASFGSSIALLIASRWILKGILILVFFFGVKSIILGDWLYVVAAWLTFNCMLEAHNWLKDTSDVKHIKHVPEETVTRIYENLKPSDSQAMSDDKDS